MSVGRLGSEGCLVCMYVCVCVCVCSGSAMDSSTAMHSSSQSTRMFR